MQNILNKEKRERKEQGGKRQKKVLINKDLLTQVKWEVKKQEEDVER